jgi:phage-related protein
MGQLLKTLPVKFFCTLSGNEPVRAWLKELDREDRRIIGNDIQTVEFGWPIGMPLCNSLSGHKDLWEIRSKITGGRIARVIFTIKHGEMILLHGFVKKTQKTPQKELACAAKRKKEHEKYA